MFYDQILRPERDGDGKVGRGYSKGRSHCEVTALKKQTEGQRCVDSGKAEEKLDVCTTVPVLSLSSWAVFIYGPCSSRWL